MSEDRSGGVGCGCALLPGLLLGLVLYAAVGVIAAGTAPALPPATREPVLRLALSERYLGQAMDSLAQTGQISNWTLDLVPGEQIHVQAMVQGSAFGRDMSLPVRLVLRVTATAGRMGLELAEAQLPGGVDAATATGMISPLLASASSEVQRQLSATLGPDWLVQTATTSDTELLLTLVPRSSPQ